MSTQNMMYGTTFQVRAANGTVLWEGVDFVGQAFMVSNGLTTSAAAWYHGTPIIVSANTTLGAPYALASAAAVDVALAGVVVASAASVGFLGVALTNVAATPATIPPFYTYPAGLVASCGSIVVTNLVSGTGAVGAYVGGSATAALGGVIAPATAAATAGLTVGVIVKAAADNGATSGIDGAGGAGRFTAGVLIAPQ